MSLGELAAMIAAASAVVGVDTGLVHLAAALGTPCITLYGATDPGLIGTLGESQRQLQAEFPCAPCPAEKMSAIRRGRGVPRLLQHAGSGQGVDGA